MFYKADIRDIVIILRRLVSLIIVLIVTDDGNDNEERDYSSDDKGDEVGGKDNKFCPTTDHCHPPLAMITTKVVST